MYVHKTCQGRTLTALSRSTQGCQFAWLLAVDAKMKFESKLKFELGLFAMQIRASMFVAITPPAADR